MRKQSDKRYRTQKWRRVRLDVLRRDGWRCMVIKGCDSKATVADHIEPVYDGMPDWEFYDPTNLRGACMAHNIARGYAAKQERAPSRYSFGRGVRPAVF